ncbi:hypothetical protein [Actinoplanes subtropicus]|uniref:hypothetical protein n=1 Tax=Actinoplanes subtropicus TaxID=543632 RepID=UPI0004C35FBE|nr:hypothetical protein [Actinoplanes subtropicus]
MRHYLVVFNRREGSIVRFAEFERANDALTARFEAEYEFMNDTAIEVVVLGAASREALQRTHGRYFQGVREMASTALGALRPREGGSSSVCLAV